ncbi:hypothetical protein Tco_0743004 [Tanacetum coccineum]
MPILHSFEEIKLECEDEDELEIKIMGTRMDKESLEHNLYENDISSIICHCFSLTSNPPIKPKDSVAIRRICDAFSVVIYNIDSPTRASDEELEEPMEDQPLPANASPTALSPGYIADSDPEDPEEDPADHPVDGGDNDDNESSDDDEDDDDVEKDE